MSDLAEALELVCGVSERLTTVRCTIDHTVNRALNDLVFDRRHQRMLEWKKATGGTVQRSFIVRHDGAPPPEIRRTRQRLWIQRPDRSRSEFFWDIDEPEPGQISIRHGPDFWTRARGRDAEHQTVREGGPGVEEHGLLAPHTLFLDELHALGRGTIGGRAVIRLRVVPLEDLHRPIREGSLGNFGDGGDDLEVAVDCESGLILRAAARVDGKDYSVEEMHDLVLGEPLDGDLFAFSLRPGESPRESPHRHIRLRLEEADQAPFTILVPPGRPVGSISLHGSGDEALASLVWREPDGSNDQQVNIFESPAQAPRADVHDFEQHQQDGEEFAVRRNTDAEGNEWWAVEVVRHGTRARVQSSLALERIVAIALSLRPVPTDAPQLEDLA
jgi:hypothetical protein